ncbi:hypothetical protein ACFVZA_23360 [Streptomyces bottropensis]|uniref:hypothetical protein n=1 Tax=Streptomyces bottropensis TaxID=42235 RepID=UPI00368A6745
MVVTGHAGHRLVRDRTMAARARRVLKAEVKEMEMEKTKEIRGRGPTRALLAEHLRAARAPCPEPAGHPGPLHPADLLGHRQGASMRSPSG